MKSRLSSAVAIHLVFTRPAGVRAEGADPFGAMSSGRMLRRCKVPPFNSRTTPPGFVPRNDRRGGRVPFLQCAVQSLYLHVELKGLPHLDQRIEVRSSIPQDVKVELKQPALTESLSVTAEKAKRRSKPTRR